MGVGTNYSAEQKGHLLTLRAGDVIVQPAGTAHSTVSSDDYHMMSFSPNVSLLFYPFDAGFIYFETSGLIMRFVK